MIQEPAWQGKQGAASRSRGGVGGRAGGHDWLRHSAPARRSLLARRFAGRLERKVVAIGLDAAPPELHAFHLAGVVVPARDGGLAGAGLQRLQAAAPGVGFVIGTAAGKGQEGDIWREGGDEDLVGLGLEVVIPSLNTASWLALETLATAGHRVGRAI